MWKATRISADAAEKMQINAGILLNTFDIKKPVAPADTAIVCETTGDFSITCVPTTEDLFADVNNAPTNTKEGKHIIGWTCTIGLTALSVTAETIKLALGAANISTANAIVPRDAYTDDDFTDLWWIGDMIDSSKLLVVKLINSLSTGGLSITTTNKGKGKLGITLTGHTSLSDQNTVPMVFWVVEKSEGTAATNVEEE